MKFVITKRHPQPILLLCVELFFIVFSIHILPFEGLFTFRNIDIGFVILIYYFFYKGNPNKLLCENDKIWVFGMFCLLFYVFILMSINSSPKTSHNSAQETLNFVVMVVLLPLIFSKIEWSVSRFTKALIFVTDIQALIVLACFLSPEVRSFIFDLQSWEEDFLLYRVCGLGIAGAGGTVYLFCGFLANCYYMLFYHRNLFYYISAVVILFATMLVGRTGFYMEIILLLYTLFPMIRSRYRKKQRLSNYILIFGAFIIIGIIVYYAENTLDVNYDMLNSSYNRLDDIVEGRTLNAIGSMAVPDLTLSTLFFGTGYGKSQSFNGELIWNDSGYVMRYNGFGAIPALFSYCFLLWYLYWHLKKIKDRSKRWFWTIPIVLMFIIEYKEEFIFYLSLPFVLIMSLKLELSSQVLESKQ